MQETMNMVQSALDDMGIPDDPQAPSPWLPLDDSTEITFVPLNGVSQSSSNDLDKTCTGLDVRAEAFRMYSYPNLIPFLVGILQRFPAMRTPLILNIKQKGDTTDLEEGSCYQVSVPPGDDTPVGTQVGTCSGNRVLCSRRRVWKASRAAAVILDLSKGALRKLRALLRKWTDIASFTGPDLNTFMKGIREKAWGNRETSSIIPDIVDSMSSMILTKAIDHLREGSSRLETRLGEIENRTNITPSLLEARVLTLENKMKTEPARTDDKLNAAEDRLTKNYARWEIRVVDMERKLTIDPTQLLQELRIVEGRLNERLKAMERRLETSSAPLSEESSIDLPHLGETETSARILEPRLALLEQEWNRIDVTVRTLAPRIESLEEEWKKFHRINKETSEVIDLIVFPEQEDSSLNMTEEGSGLNEEESNLESGKLDMQKWQTLCNSFSRCLNLIQVELSRVKRGQEEPQHEQENLQSDRTPHQKPEATPSANLDTPRTNRTHTNVRVRSRISRMYDELTKTFYTPMHKCLPCGVIIASLSTIAGIMIVQSICICVLCAKARRTSRLTKSTGLEMEKIKKRDSRTNPPPTRVGAATGGAPNTSKKPTAYYTMIRTQEHR